MSKKTGFIIRTLFPLFLILFSSPLFADAGVPMIYLGFPFMLLGLIPIIIIETIVYHKRMALNLKKLSLAVTIANTASTLIGYPLAWLFLLGIEFLTKDAGALKLPDMIFKIMEVTIYSAWLNPARNDLNWMVPVAGIFELIPAFFLSVLIEYGVIRLFYRKEDKNALLRSTWNANLFSYSFLVLSLLVIMVFFIRFHAFHGNIIHN